MVFTNDAVLNKSIVSQFGNIVTDASLDNKSAFQAYLLDGIEGYLKQVHGVVDVEEELAKAFISEIVQELDAHTIMLMDKETVKYNYSETFDFAPFKVENTPSFIGDRFAVLVESIVGLAHTLLNRDKLAMLVSPMMISVLQSAAKSTFTPANEGSFKGPNASMLVGTLTKRYAGEDITLDVYSYLPNLSYASDKKLDEIFIFNTDCLTTVVNPDMISFVDAKHSDNMIVKRIEANYTLGIKPNTVRKLIVTNFGF